MESFCRCSAPKEEGRYWSSGKLVCLLKCSSQYPHNSVSICFFLSNISCCRFSFVRTFQGKSYSSCSDEHDRRIHARWIFCRFAPCVQGCFSLSIFHLLKNTSEVLRISITLSSDHRTRMVEMKSRPAPGYTQMSWTTTFTWNHTQMIILSMVNTIHGVPVIFSTSAIYP